MPTNVPPAGRGPVRPPLFPGASLHAASRRLQGPQGRHMKCGPAAVPCLSLRGSHLMEDSFSIDWGREGRDAFRTIQGHYIHCPLYVHRLPRWLSSKESTCNEGDSGSIPGSGRSTGEGNRDPLQYSCLESHGKSQG